MSAKRRPANSKGSTPLDAKKQALADEEARLRAKAERCQRVIEEAPRRAEEARKRRREEIMRVKSRTDMRFGSRVALHDPRFGHEFHAELPMQKRKPLRRERRQGMITFFVLLLVLAGVLCWLYYTVIGAG